MKLRFRKGMFLNYFFVFVFIPPRCLYDIGNLSVITSILAAFRYILTAFFIIQFLLNKKEREYSTSLYLLTYIMSVLIQIVALNRNGSFYLTAVLSCLSFVGFLLGNIIFYHEYKGKLFLLYRNYLGLCMVIHLFTIILLPYGMSGGAVGVNRVYFMGLKNSVTPYVILWFLVFYLALEEKCMAPNRKFKYVCYSALFATAFSIINASSAHVGAMVVIDGYLLMTFLVRSHKKTERFLQRMYVVSIVIFVCFFFYYVVLLESGNNEVTGIITSAFGKDTTFSGRRAIWAGAIRYISKSPFWGMGLDVQYDVWANSRYVYSAHNMFLDYGVKYGCVALFFNVLSILVAFKSAVDCRKNEKVRMCLVVSSSLILAALFEAVEGYYPTWLTILLMYLISKTVKERTFESLPTSKSVINRGKVLAG